MSADEFRAKRQKIDDLINNTQEEEDGQSIKAYCVLITNTVYCDHALEEKLRKGCLVDRELEGNVAVVSVSRKSILKFLLSCSFG